MFKEINPRKIKENSFDLIGKQWMLIAAGNRESNNVMTASWGGFGFLWNFPVAFIFIRPQRHTYQFVEAHDFFTLSFFEKAHKEMLTFCGTRSGKDVDKIKETGLIAQETNMGNLYFEQSKLVLECKKVYAADIDPKNLKDKLINRNYPNKDYHRMYVGKIVNVLERTE